MISSIIFDSSHTMSSISLLLIISVHQFLSVILLRRALNTNVLLLLLAPFDSLFLLVIVNTGKGYHSHRFRHLTFLLQCMVFHKRLNCLMCPSNSLYTFPPVVFTMLITPAFFTLIFIQITHTNSPFLHFCYIDFPRCPPHRDLPPNALRMFLCFDIRLWN